MDSYILLSITHVCTPISLYFWQVKKIHNVENLNAGSVVGTYVRVPSPTQLRLLFISLKVRDGITTTAGHLYFFSAAKHPVFSKFGIHCRTFS